MPKQKPLLDFVKTHEEYEIASIIDKDVPLGRLQGMDKLVEIVAQWRMYLGIPQHDASEEIAINSAFIYEHYPHLTLNEIKLAYTYVILGKTENVEFYGNFSVAYIAKVLNAYLYYRRVTMADLIRRKEKYEQEQLEKSTKPSPEEEQKVTVWIFEKFYKEWEETGEVSDICNLCFRFLREHKMLVITKEQTEEAMKYGAKKALSVEQKRNPLVEAVAPKEKETQRWARNWCVAEYFKNNTLQSITDQIKPELFK